VDANDSGKRKAAQMTMAQPDTGRIKKSPKNRWNLLKQFFGRIGVLLTVFVMTASVSFQTTPVLASGSDAQPLMPPTTESPRATLLGFKTAMEEVFLAATLNSGRQVQALRRAARYLDLSKIPPRFVGTRSIEAALMLKEVLDRVGFPPTATVPDRTQVDVARSDRQSSSKSALSNLPYDQWRFPNTEIKITLVKNGPRVGEFLFSPETVRRVSEYYARVRHLPYKSDATPGMYLAYISTPGHGLALSWGNSLPNWSQQIIANQAVWQWCATVAALLLTAVLVSGVLMFARRIERPGFSETNRARPWRSRLPTLVALGVSIGSVMSAEWFIGEIVNLKGIALEATTYVLAFFMYLFLVWLISLVILQVAEVIIVLRGFAPEAAGARLLRLASCGLVAFVVLGIFVAAAEEFGLPAYSIIAGLGVGGIAVGFGAQKLVSDVFSGFFFTIDDAFRINEYIDTGSAKGTVEKISIRSVQLRHHNGPLNTIPFGEIKYVTNYSRDWVTMKLPIRVPFGTDIERLRKSIKKLGEELLDDLIIGHTFVEPLKSQGVIQFDDFGIVIRLKFTTVPGEQFMARRVIYQRIQELFRIEGIEFAGREVKIRPPLDGDVSGSLPAETSATVAEIGGDDTAIRTPQR
jgi:small-conductance mechanosensitive channel